MTGLTDPFALQVHRPLAAGPDEILPLLPPYVRRKHDDALAAVVAASVDGASRMAVLVGGSSTGKTRACWEAVTASSALPGWRLWYPYDPTPPEGLLEGLPRAGPRTVIWLDDAQLYLQHSLGERAASALRTVLGDRRRAPVLVLGTMWPEYWNKLTSEAGSRRTLLEGTLIHVPDAFTCAELDVLRSAADPRLAAASTAREGRVTQFLAGAPILLERYQTAEPPARAVIEAAMDARRLGYGQDLPLAFLANAAPGYMTDSEWDAAGDAWLEQALAYTAEPAKGAAGPVGPTRSRPSSRGRSDSSQPNLAPSYRLADYLDEHGRKRRVVSFPPDGFWEAAAVAPPDDQVALAWSAESRGLYRRAAQLHKDATFAGHSEAAVSLISLLRRIDSGDLRPLSFAAAHSQADEPFSAAGLLHALSRAADWENARVVAERAAASIPVDDPGPVGYLLHSMRGARAYQQAGVLAGRAAAEFPLDHLDRVADMLKILRGTGTPLAALAERAVAGAAVDDQNLVWLLDHLWNVGATKHAEMLAWRAAAGVSLDKPDRVAALLDSLQDAEAEQQWALLAARAADGIAVDDPDSVRNLIYRLRRAGADELAEALAARAAASVAMDHPDFIAALLYGLKREGMVEQAAALAARAAASVATDSPRALARLLRCLQEIGAEAQTQDLLARDPAAAVTVNCPSGVAFLIDILRTLKGENEAAALAERAAANAPLDKPEALAKLLEGFQCGGIDQPQAVLARRAANGVTMDRPDQLAELLRTLHEIGAHEQAAVLARRAANGVTMDRPAQLGVLLRGMREIGADDQVAVLLARDPAISVPLDDTHAVGGLLYSMLQAGAEEQVETLARRAAASTPLDEPEKVIRLVDRLRSLGRRKQAAILAGRAAGDMPLNDHLAITTLLNRLQELGDVQQAAILAARATAAGYFSSTAHADDARYRFGRHPDGSPARPWSWDNLV